MEVISEFLLLPVGGRFIILLGIVFVLYCIFGRLLCNFLSLVLFLLKKLIYVVYLIIEIPISTLHKLLGGIIFKIDQGIASIFDKLCLIMDKCYNILHRPKTIHRDKAFLIYLILIIYLAIPIITGLNTKIFTFWEKSYIKNETKLVEFTKKSWLFSKTSNTVKIQKTEDNKELESSSIEDYILPFSSTRELNEDDLKGLTKKELRIARNEIFARNGRQFKEEDLRSYFESKLWYQNLIKLPFGTEPQITQLEESNALFIISYE